VQNWGTTGIKWHFEHYHFLNDHYKELKQEPATLNNNKIGSSTGARMLGILRLLNATKEDSGQPSEDMAWAKIAKYK
jgi:hypothetical protein